MEDTPLKIPNSNGAESKKSPLYIFVQFYCFFNSIFEGKVGKIHYININIFVF